MWNAWKSCNEEFQPRSPPLEDGDIWKNYCQHLFENETNKHDSSSTPRLNKNIKLNTHNLSEFESVKLNMQFSIKELKKVLKKLRNGKSPGIDRISNEMIKASFDTLRKSYANLFNLALTVGEVPNIWCKGLITPVFKNGDAFNPENYRPICVLSCLCKFFTNALNIRLFESTKRGKIINHVQIGFSENHRTTDHIFILKSIISKNVSNSARGKVYSCFVDF